MIFVSSHNSISSSHRFSVLGPKFSLFTIRANEKRVAEMTARAELNRAYIEALETLLTQNNIQLPPKPVSASMLASISIQIQMSYTFITIVFVGNVPNK